MQIQGPHNGSGTADAVFSHVANGTTTAISAGQSVIFYTSASTGNSGYEVAQGVAPTAEVTGANPLGGLICGCAHQDGPAASGGQTFPFLVQVYGRVQVTMNDPGADLVAGVFVEPAASGGWAYNQAAAAGDVFAGVGLEAHLDSENAAAKYIFLRCM